MDAVPEKVAALNKNLQLLARALQSVTKVDGWQETLALQSLSLLAGHEIGSLDLDRDALEAELDLFCKRVRDAARIVWKDQQELHSN